MVALLDAVSFLRGNGAVTEDLRARRIALRAALDADPAPAVVDVYARRFGHSQGAPPIFGAPWLAPLIEQWTAAMPQQDKVKRVDADALTQQAMDHAWAKRHDSALSVQAGPDDGPDPCIPAVSQADADLIAKFVMEHRSQHSALSVHTDPDVAPLPTPDELQEIARKWRSPEETLREQAGADIEAERVARRQQYAADTTDAGKVKLGANAGPPIFREPVSADKVRK